LAKGGEGVSDIKNKKIVMIIASENFRDEELNIPLGNFKEGGAEVVIASSSLDAAKGMLGAVVKATLLYSDIDVNSFDAIVFIGGSGASEYWDDPTAHKIANDAASKGKVLAAICIAPVTLARAGVIEGKRATVWPSEKEQLVKAKVKYTAKAVEVDGNIVTANGPQSADRFSKEIIKLLSK